MYKIEVYWTNIKWWSQLKRESNNVFTKAFADKNVKRLYKKYEEELKTKNIDWNIDYNLYEVLKGDWAEYTVEGCDQNGLEYLGNTQTSSTFPMVEEVYNIYLKD